MTVRTERDHRRQERRMALKGRLGRRVLSRRTTGVDGLVKRLLLRGAPDEIPHDPELDHPSEWDRPIE